ALITKNIWNCADTIVRHIVVDADFSLYVPDAFTPNGDDLNDIFLPVVRSSKQYQLRIFDRWGKLIFQSSDPNKGWDGKVAGVNCMQGIYVWRINVSSFRGQTIEKSGHVTLMGDNR